MPAPPPPPSSLSTGNGKYAKWQSFKSHSNSCEHPAQLPGPLQAPDDPIVPLLPLAPYTSSSKATETNLDSTRLSSS